MPRRADSGLVRCCGAGTALSPSAARPPSPTSARAPSVPGANDNLTGVADAPRARPRPARAAGRRAFACCSSRPGPRSPSWRACTASRGATSPNCSTDAHPRRLRRHRRLARELIAARGRGHAADARLPGVVQGAAVAGRGGARASTLRRGLRFRNATDGLIALRAGYQTVDARLGRPRTSCRRTTTGRRDTAEQRRLRHRRSRRSACVRRVARRRLAALSSASGPADRRPRASRPRPRSAPRRARRAARRAAGPAAMPSASASSSPRTSGAGAPSARRSQRRAEHLAAPSSRCAAIAASALRPAGGEAVGDRQQRHVDLDRVAARR